ncbi:MAG: hypothetical protein J0H41_18375 [Rhizobiales bacterium]|nr:hypothetical protein [Hyphomicrobiales bacterium]
MLAHRPERLFKMRRKARVKDGAETGRAAADGKKCAGMAQLFPTSGGRGKAAFTKGNDRVA